MPRLPGFESLGGNQTDATRPTGSYDVSPLARGGQALAQGVETLGRGVSKVGDDVAEVLRKQNQSLFLNAHANIASGLANLNTSFVGDKDYATLQQRYNDQAQALIKQNAETIPPGNYRTHFLATANELVAHGGTAIAHQAYGGIVKADDDQLKLELDKATDDINKNPGNPMRGAQIDALGLRVDNAVNNGWKTPEEGDLLKRDIAIKTRTAELQLLATHGIVPNPDLAVRPKAGEQEDAIMRASARSGIPEDTLRNIAKPSPIDSSINPMTMYHFNAVASSAELRRLNDERRLGKQRSQVAADEAVLGSLAAAPPGSTPVTGGRFTPVVNDAISKASAATGVSEATLRRFAQIESGGDPDSNRERATQYKGLFNLSGAEFAKHGSGDIFDASDNAMAAAQKLRTENAVFQARYGRAATDADLYLIHNQGQAGYAAHLANPTAPAWQNMFSTPEGQSKGEAWAKKAIWGNIPDDPRTSPAFNKTMFPGGVDAVTSADFTQGWAAKVNGGGGGNAALAEPAPGSRPVAASLAEQRAAAMQRAFSNPNLKTDEERMDAMSLAKNHFNLMEVAANQTEQGRKEVLNQAANQYTQQMWDGLHTPNFDWVKFAGQVNHDPALDGDNGEMREKLLERIAKRSGEEGMLTFGAGFMGVKQRVLSEPGSDGHIASMADVYRLPPNTLTAAGEKEIGNVIAAIKKSPDEAALQKAKAGMEQYAKLTMSRERDLGPVKLADPKGELKFHGDFLPQFNAAYSKWVSDGNDPWKFLEKDNVNKFIDRVYPPKERSMDAAVGGGTDKPEAPNAPLPPAPKDIQPENWEKAVVKPPLMDNGQPMTHARWAGILNKLLADPSEETMAALDSHLGDSGYTAQQLLKTLDPNRIWEKQGGKEFPKDAAEVPGESFSETPPGVGGVPFGEGMGLAAGSKASPKEMSEFQRQQQDPNNPAVRFRKFLETGMHPEAVKEKRHPDEESR